MTWHNEPTEEDLRKTLPSPKRGNKDVFEEIRSNLFTVMDQFAAILPNHISPERFITITIMALKDKPELLGYDRISLYKSCAQAAADGLFLDGKEAALVPFKGKIKYSPMVYGILKLCRQGGDLKTITVQEIFEKDKFSFWVDESGEHLEHRPEFFVDRGKRIGVYAIGRMADGMVQTEIMGEKELNAVKNIAAKGGPWSGPFEGEMAKKTVIRRLAKRMKLSPEITRTINRDDQFYSMDSKTSGLAGELNGRKNQLTDPKGDSIKSLSDLREPTNRPLPHPNQEGDTGERTVESPANVQTASPDAAPDRMEEIPANLPKSRGSSKGKRVGNSMPSIPGGETSTDAPENSGETWQQ